MKAPLPTEELRYDMSQFYPLKEVLEKLLGHRVYLRLKETGTLRDWKAEIRKLLLAIKTAIESTIELADDDWFAEVDSILEYGEKRIQDSKTITQLFAYLSATLTKLVFLQIGFFPSGRFKREIVPLTKEWWTLNPVRTVQYVQNRKQRACAQRLRDKKIEAARQLDDPTA